MTFDAYAVTVGHFTATVMALLAFRRWFVASVMMLFDRLWNQLLHARTGRDGPADEVWRWPARFLFQHLSGSSAIRSLHRRLPAFGIVSDLISTHARKEHLRLSHDGVGDRGNRRPQASS